MSNGSSLRETAAGQLRKAAHSRVREHGAALDVRDLPSFGFGHRSLMWWATLGLIAIESTVFAMAIGTYFYLMAHSTQWPPTEQPPQLPWGTLNTVLFIASLVPAWMSKRHAEALDLPRVRLWVSVSTVTSLVILAVRGMELQTLNCSWNGSAYGSAVWMIMGLHTLHLVTDAYDTGVLNVLVFTGPLEGRRFVDVSENAVYWLIVVFSWLPVYAVIYGVPRWV
jgi:heme/copper-type cytochrome/quinol oxidase subunit 3